MPYITSPAENEPPRKPPGRKNGFRWAVLVLSVGLIVYGAVRLAVYGAELAASRRTTQELREIAAEPDARVPSAPAVTPEAAPEEPAVQAEGPHEAKTVQAAEPAEEPDTAPETKAAEPAEGPDTGHEATAAEPAEAQAAPPETLPPLEYPNGLRINPRIQKLRQKSEYIAGWITMDDLDEPVVLKDNTFFLDHDAMGNKNSNGALFMDEDTDLQTPPYTILIYGHNMKSGAMFGNLRKYEDSPYCSRHRMLRLETLYDEGEYAVFAVAEVSIDSGSGRFVSLAGIQSADRRTRRDALQGLKDLSVHSVILDVDETDRLLLLVTCVGDDDDRLIVAARRLRDGETQDSLTFRRSFFTD